MCTYYPWVKGIEVVHLKGQILFEEEIITKVLNGVGSFKNLIRSQKA
jgi:hypothetical protein